VDAGRPGAPGLYREVPGVRPGATTPTRPTGPWSGPSSCANAPGAGSPATTSTPPASTTSASASWRRVFPPSFQTPEEIKRQRKIHDKLIEKGLQLISDSFLDQTEKRCKEAGVPLTRQLLEGINYEEIVREANRGAGRLPSLIGFDPNIADKYDGGETVRATSGSARTAASIAEDEDAGREARRHLRPRLRPARHRRPRHRPQPYSQLGGVVGGVLRGGREGHAGRARRPPLAGGRWMVCVDGSSYSYKAMRIALEMAREFGASLYVCSAFDVEYHHAVFGNIKDVLSVQASKVFKFEEQEELHNNIIDKGLLKLCQANLKRARSWPRVPRRRDHDADPDRQALPVHPPVGRGGRAVAAGPRPPRQPPHRGHRPRLAGREPGAAGALQRAPHRHARASSPDEIPWIEEDGETGARVGARGRGPHPPRAPLRAGHRPQGGGGVRAGQLRPGPTATNGGGRRAAPGRRRERRRRGGASGEREAALGSRRYRRP
jgi:hypothetical protein